VIGWIGENRLPIARFVEAAISICHGAGKLANFQDPLPDRFDKCGDFTQLYAGRTLKWIENNHPFLEIVPHDLNGFNQIRIIADDNRDAVCSEVTIVKQVCGDVDIRSLFFGLDHLDKPRLARRAIRQRHADRVR
jgi:hypothetical protein